MEDQNRPILTTGDWFITLLITAIPLIGLIMLFVWAFSGSVNPNKANWAKASLIWVAIGILLSIIFFAIIGVSFFKGYF
ncbi:MAG: hypothetical protein K0B08_09730 [Bacteroidales bacterium]|nr:hypothetical protein [Bacteroidales bacterium]